MFSVVTTLNIFISFLCIHQTDIELKERFPNVSSDHFFSYHLVLRLKQTDHTTILRFRRLVLHLKTLRITSVILLIDR